MTLQSPAIGSPDGGMGALPTRYTCNGEDSWPQLIWTGVPAGTAELAIYAMNAQPVDGRLFVDWAVAGLDPSLTSLEPGRLPQGAIVGTNSFGKRGYSICPPGGGELYVFAVYALPTRLSLPAGFDARDVRKRILDVSGNAGLLATSYGGSQ